jgi:hypothetical protein
MINDTIKRVLIWRFTLVLIKINYGQIGDQTGLFYTTNPVFYTSGKRFVRRTGAFGNLTFSLVLSDSRNTRSTCPTSVFTGIGQTLMSRPEYIGGSFKYIQFKRHFNRNLISMNIYSQQQYCKFCIEKFGLPYLAMYNMHFFTLTK